MISFRLELFDKNTVIFWYNKHRVKKQRFQESQLKAIKSRSGWKAMKKPAYLQITVIVLTGLLLLFACLPMWTGAAPHSLAWNLLYSGFVLVVSFQLILCLILIGILSQIEFHLPKILFYSCHAYRGPPQKTA